MGGLTGQPQLSTDRESNWLPILLGVAFVIVVAGGVAFLLRTPPKGAAALHPYASRVRLSDLKMSASENFVGASVTYIDGTVTNTGDRTITHAIIHVIFRNSLNEVAQAQDEPLHVLQTNGPYPEAVDLSVSPLPPGQSKPFRLTFEHVTADWNQAYPELQVTDVVLK